MPLLFCLVRVKLIDMKQSNKGLFDKKRFKYLKQEREKYLKGLSLKESIIIMEGLIGLANELQGNFLPDRPVCVKIGLTNQK